jgi:hypothetical protein
VLPERCRDGRDVSTVRQRRLVVQVVRTFEDQAMSEPEMTDQADGVGLGLYISTPAGPSWKHMAVRSVWRPAVDEEAPSPSRCPGRSCLVQGV